MVLYFLSALAIKSMRRMLLKRRTKGFNVRGSLLQTGNILVACYDVVSYLH